MSLLPEIFRRQNGSASESHLHSSSASSADEWNENTTENLKKTKPIGMEYGMDIGSMNQTNLIAVQLDRQTGLVLQASLNRLLDNTQHFSICQLDNIMDATGLGSRKHPTYKKLLALHCIDYSAMPRELRAMIPQMINEVLLAEVKNEAAHQAMAGITY